MTLDDFKKMLIRQNYVCEICKNPQRKIYKRTGVNYELVVDHCHENNRVRGLLCDHCNVGLGRFKDKISYIKSALEYLEKYCKDHPE